MALPSDGIKPEYIIDVLIRRRWIVIIPFCLAMIAGCFLAVFLPKIYEAKTLILVEPQRVPTEYVQSLVSTDIESRINTISQQILSRTNLEKIIEEFGLFSDPESKKMFVEDKIENLRKRISVDVTRDRRRETDAFSITYKGKNPQTVMKVANGLAASFIEENLKVREMQAIGTSDFLEDELNTMRVKLASVEEQLKQYRQTYMGELPEQLETNLRILDRLQESMTERVESLRDEKNRLSVIENQIQLMREQATTVAGVGAGGTSTGPTTLVGLKAQLEDLRTRYTEKHPDIVRLKSRIAELEAKKATESNTENKNPQTGEDASMDLGTDIDLIRQREETRREIQTLETEISELRAQTKFYQKRVEDTPKREQELLTLRRDYENIQAAYNSLLNRKLEAEIAVNMEKKQKGEQFRIIDAARLPQKPVEPDMKKLFLLVFAAGLGIGGGIVFLLEYMDSSISKPEEVESLLELPVLATIPVIYQPKDKVRRRFRLFLDAFAVTISGILFVSFAALAFVGVDPVMELIRKYINI